MQFILISFATIAFHICALAQPKTAPVDPARLQKIRQWIQENEKKQIPNMIPEEIYKELKISTPLCDTKKLTDSIKSCVYFKCLQKFDVMGMYTIYAEAIVHGMNAAQYCAVSAAGKRYFVPKADLTRFSKGLLAGTDVSNLSISGSFGTDKSTQVQTFKIEGKTCKVKTESRNEVDPTNTEIVKFTPPKPDGTEVTLMNGKKDTYHTVGGKTYHVKSGELKTIPKLTSYALEPGSPPECHELGATIVFELEKKGLVQTFSNESGN